MRPDQKYMPDFSRRDDDNDYDNDLNFDNEDGNDTDDINLVPFNTQLPYNVLTTGWIPVFIFDNSKSPTNISTNMSATIPNSPMGISNPFGQQFTMPNLSNLGGNNLGAQNLNYTHTPMGGTAPEGQFATPYYPTSNAQGFPSGYNPWSIMGPTSSGMMGGFDGTTPGSMPGTFSGATPSGGMPGTFSGSMTGTFSGTTPSGGMTSQATGVPSGFGGTTPSSGMTSSPTGVPGGFGGTTPSHSTPLGDDFIPYNINATNYMNPRQDIDITEIIKNFDLDLDEDLDLTRVNSDKKIDDIFTNITQKHQEIVSLLKAYNIPFPIIKLLIRKIIKISLIHGKRIDE